jgi:hypothetical protein
MKKDLYFSCVFMGTCIFPCLFTKKVLELWLSKVELEWNKSVCRIIEACSITFIAVGVIFSLPHFFGHCLELQKE